MTTQKYLVVAHMGHDALWLQIKTAKEVKERRAYIRVQKPEYERPLRLKLLKEVKAPLPPKLAKASAAWDKAKAVGDKADAAWVTAILSKEGVAFHKQVCGCAWTPKRPDILMQLEERG